MSYVISRKALRQARLAKQRFVEVEVSQEIVDKVTAKGYLITNEIPGIIQESTKVGRKTTTKFVYRGPVNIDVWNKDKQHAIELALIDLTGGAEDDAK